MRRSRFVAPKRVESFEDVRKALQLLQEQLDAQQPKRPSLITKDTTLRAGESVRLSPRGGATLFAKLPKASAENFGQSITLLIERPNGTVRVCAQSPDTVVGVGSTNFTTAGLVVLISNGIDAWCAPNELPSTSPAASALDAEYVLGAAHASLPNGIEPTADRQVPVAGGGTAVWRFPIEAQLDDADLGDVHTINREDGRFSVASGIATFELPQAPTDTRGGTLNAWALPAGVKHNDTVSLIASSSITLNGIDATGIPSGFRFILNFSDGGVAGRTLTINDESASAAATDRISTLADLQMLNPTGASFWVIRTATRWGIVDRSIIHVQDDGVQQGPARQINALSSTTNSAVATISAGVASLSYQRAALTGAISAAANANATQFAGIRDNGTLETSRGFVNVLSTSTITALITQDAGNDEQEWTWNVNLAAAYAWTGNHTHSAGNWTMNSAGDFSATAATVGVISNSTMLLDAVGDMTLQSDGNVVVQADALYLDVDGFLLLESSAASTPSVGTNHGLFWVVDGGASAFTLPRYTDDNNNDRYVQLSFDVMQTSTATGAIGTVALRDEENVFRWNGGANGDISGFSGNLWNGRQLLVRNASGTAGRTLTINHDSAGTAAHGVHGPANAAVVVRNRGSTLLTYDTTSSRWFHTIV